MYLDVITLHTVRFCFAKLVETGLLVVLVEQHALYTISAQTSQEGIECSKAKE